MAWSIRLSPYLSEFEFNRKMSNIPQRIIFAYNDQVFGKFYVQISKLCISQSLHKAFDSSFDWKRFISQQENLYR